MRTAIVASVLIVVISCLAMAGPWISWNIDFLPREPPSQQISLDVGFNIPFIYPGLSLDVYTGLLLLGDGPYIVAGKPLGFSFIYQSDGLYLKAGMYNCGVDRDHFYFEGSYHF